MKFSTLLLACVLVPPFPALAHAEGDMAHDKCEAECGTRISVAEGKQLVYEALKPAAASAGLDYYPARQTEEGFYILDALNVRGAASLNLGSFAVNKATGEVWDLQGLWNAAGRCQKITKPALARMQEGIRLRFKFSAQQYQKLQALKPACETEDDETN